jgi:hypothetical protein
VADLRLHVWLWYDDSVTYCEAERNKYIKAHYSVLCGYSFVSLIDIIASFALLEISVSANDILLTAVHSFIVILMTFYSSDTILGILLSLLKLVTHSLIFVDTDEILCGDCWEVFSDEQLISLKAY